MVTTKGEVVAKEMGRLPDVYELSNLALPRGL